MLINDFYIFPLFFTHDNLQIVHGTEGHMAVYGPGYRPQNIYLLLRDDFRIGQVISARVAVLA